MSEQALQSSLLRLVVLCSTGLSTFLTSSDAAAAPLGIYLDASDDTPLPSIEHFTQVRSQIRSDALTILTDIGKRSTNLSLALKKSRAANANAENASSPTAGLDAGSLKAAQDQIDAFTNDLLPKLVFLAQKALKEQSVYVRRPQQRDDASAKEERTRLEALAKEMGGKVMTGAELGLASSTSPAAQKQANLGIGCTWSRILKIHTQDVLDSIASLAETCMDKKTKEAVKAAQKARDRFDGVSGGGGSASGNAVISVSTRAQCLSKTAAVWDATDQAIKAIPEDNTCAVKKRFAERRDVMQDGIDELKEALEDASGQDGAPPADDDDVDDLNARLDTMIMSLSTAQKDLAGRLVPLIRMGKLLHDRIASEGLAAAGCDADDVDSRAVTLAERQDDLVAALLYGEGEEGDEDSEDSGDDDDEDASDDAPHSAVKLTGTRAVAELYLDAARLLFDSTSGKDAKAQMIVQEMVKLVDGIEASAWEESEEGVQA